MIRPNALRVAKRTVPAPRLLSAITAGLAGLLFPAAGQGHAASAEWTGAIDSDWATPGNWNASPVPGTGDTATFDATHNDHTIISLGAGVTVRNLVFNRTSAPYTVGAAPTGSEVLTLNHNGSITLPDRWPDTQFNASIQAAVVLGTDAATAAYTLACQRGGYHLAFFGNIRGGTGGTAGTKTLNLGSPADGYTSVDGIIGGGEGTIGVTINGHVGLIADNTFTGPLAVNSGGLYIARINDAGVPGPLGAGTSKVQLAGWLDYSGNQDASSTRPFTIGNGARIAVDVAGTVLTLNGVIDGSGMLEKNGTGTLVLTARNTQTGGIAISMGAVRTSGLNATLGDASGALALGPAGKLELYGTNQTVSNLYGTGGTIVNNNTGTSVLTVTTGTGTFAGVIADKDNSSTGITALTHSGTGTLTLTGGNTYSGATSITGGVVVVSGGGTLGNTTGTTTVASGATLSFSGAAVGAESITISGSGAAGRNGALTGADSTCAALLQLGADGTVSADSGSFHLTNPGTINSPTRKLTLTGAGNGSLASIIGTTTGTVTKTGNGTWTLSGANTFTGALSVTNGTLAVPAVNNASADGPLGHSTTPVTLNNGTLEYTGAAASSTKPFALANTCMFKIDNAATELILTGLISGTGGVLIKSGPGTLTLTNGSNSYSGGTGVDPGGTLKFSGSGRPGATSGDLTVLGTLDLNGTSQTVGTFAGNGTVTNNGGGVSTLTVVQAAGIFGGFHGAIVDNTNSTAGTVALVKGGTGILEIDGLNTFSGTTTVTSGMLAISSSTGLGSPLGGTIVNSGATMQFYPGVNIPSEPITISGTGATGYGGALLVHEGTCSGLLKLGASATIVSRSGASDTFRFTNTGIITGSGFTLALDGDNGSIASIIGTGTGGLIKNGTGTWTLNGANTHTGTTTINEGILNIQNANALGAGASNDTTIISGATLQIEGGITTPAAEGVTIRGAGAAGATGALENVSGTNIWAGLVTLGADSTISSDSGTFSLTGTISGATHDLTLSGAGDGAITGVIGTSGTLTKTGAGKWSLTGLNTYTGKTLIPNGILEIKTLKNSGSGSSFYSSLGAPTNATTGTIDIGSDATTGTLRFTGTTDATSNRIINLAGKTFGATLDSSSATHNKLVLTGNVTATGSGSKTLTLTGTGTGANEISGAIVDNSGTNKTSVAKTGTGNWTLSGTNTYTGLTSVSVGTLVLKATIADTADLSLTTGATLHLPLAVTDSIHHLFIDGVVQSPGLWGGPASTATYRTSLISGSGLLSVSGGASLPPYASWIASYALTGTDAAFGTDPDKDGTANGLEWILGGNPLANSPGFLPVASIDGNNFIVTCRRNDASETEVELVAEWDIDPGYGSPRVVPITPGPSGPYPDNVFLDVSEQGSAPDIIELTIPRSNSPQGRLFVRLKATRP